MREQARQPERYFLNSGDRFSIHEKNTKASTSRPGSSSKRSTDSCGASLSKNEAPDKDRETYREINFLRISVKKTVSNLKNRTKNGKMGKP
ncbi:hypothetical protein [Methanosarcina acetivorans]|uniref:Uncharacterized protein n=1 Tax=Methanosarcina acetivorans (strain ATCC 35395 / DSM 2834 / JCM 12185 / C2A) TaxID=188937 RepID=Q8TIQ2_METAC|nr:hypothetical protein [Methanosarcina acetivorans]AAM07438.1 predicted protein [Methanosarcina acetivorans C2A]